MPTPHQLNIIVHVAFGTLALLVGLGPLLARKGGAAHGRLGRWFLGLAAGALATAVLGLAVFNFRPFLAGVVLLSVYQAYAGYRTVRIRATGPTRRDGWVSAVFLAGGLVFLALLPRIRLGWSPVVMHSTLGGLLAVTAYDLGRLGWRARWRRGPAWRYEHIWKLVGTFLGAALGVHGHGASGVLALQPVFAVGAGHGGGAGLHAAHLPAPAQRRGTAGRGRRASTLAVTMNDRRFRWWGIPALASLIALLNGPYPGPDAGRRFAVTAGFALYFTAGFWLGNRARWGWLLRRLPRVDQTARRLWALAGLSVAFAAGATVLLTLPLHWLLPQWFSLRPADLLRQMRFNLVPTVAVQTLYEAIYFFRQWEANVRRADRLARAAWPCTGPASATTCGWNGGLAPGALARRVAPLSVQLLVEKALKHNVASRQHPLHLRLGAREALDFLTVENTLRPRAAGSAPDTGKGLANVRQRYALLGAARPVEAGASGGTFTVRLLLLPLPVAGAAWFGSRHDTTTLVAADGRRFVVDYTLEQLEGLLDPARFFRLNRQYLAQLPAVRRLVPYFGGKLRVELHPAPAADVLVSKEKAPAVKAWLEG